MKKELICMLTTACMAISLLAGCSTAAPTETTAETVAETTAETESESVETADVVQNGYHMDVDSALFQFSSEGGTDSYTYTGETELPVYVAVQNLPETTPDDLAAGLKQQYDSFTMEDEEVIFADGIPARNFYRETEVDGLTQIQIFYILSVGDGSMLVEIGTYVGAGDEVDPAIEAMVDSFTLTE